MQNSNIMIYILRKKIVSIPEVQKEFGLGYREVREFFSSLIEKKKLFLKDELYYEYSNEVEEVPLLYKQVLWESIKLNRVSIYRLEKKFSLTNTQMKNILEWMSENDFINSRQVVLITKEEFIERFGIIESEEKEDSLDLSDFFVDATKDMKDELALQKELLQKRISEIEDNQEETDTSDDFKNLKDFLEEMQAKHDEEISKIKEDKEFIEKYHATLVDTIKKHIDKNKADLLGILDSTVCICINLESIQEEKIYRKMYKEISELTEEEFQELKKSILEEE